MMAARETQVVNLRLAPYDVYIGRAGRYNYIGRTGRHSNGYFGNPFVIGRDGTREEVLQKYAAYFLDRVATDSEFKRKVESLRGAALGCFCKPEACHGDVIAAWLDGRRPRTFLANRWWRGAAG